MSIVVNKETMRCPNCGGPMGQMGTAPPTTDWQCSICFVWGRYDEVQKKWLQLRRKLHP